ncbi:TrmH family RNA methyltransferase [Parendozoicomonas haliclonae]|uniref:23S rRNA (Guanosine-2'-O-)-methyltransferase RlmB n=1 Tax=Parendozoicomonas haliclonae TaxID=1960125 RepID=A0A1X7AQS1_9GAMM|nr:RNA methyltransferase [Parendozoicomonas haliclonae]SMA50585.1 23S rRNA (guanosine-2'-O-)-methyltransferase RlmB [Parendozoicomonas haliclonae]
MNKSDSAEYLARKRFFDQLLTVYGRKPVLEALQEKGVKVHRLHLAESNKSAPILDEIISLAEAKGAEVLYHDRKALSRISKNSKQDQGVAVDLVCAGYGEYKDFLANPPRKNFELLALDGITNPQNLGMIIRSACAGEIDGILLPKQGNAKIDPLVIKASAGTLFKARLLRCDNLAEALKDFQNELPDNQCNIYGLSSHADYKIGDSLPQGANIFVLGNETDGVSKEVSQLCDKMLAIPMNNGVESLNVAVTASLLAFRKVMAG